MTPEPPWRHPVVRDLYTVLSAPSIMRHSGDMPSIEPATFDVITQNAKAWLRDLDQNPKALQAHIQAMPRHNRLGLYYEALLSFWMRHHGQWRLLAHELPVYDGKRTIGAYDFLVETEKGVVHIETAVKYYLGVRGESNWFDWVGPGLNDCLALKMQKMLTKQLQLSETSAGLQALAERNIPAPHHKKLWFKGMYFRPYKANPQVHPDKGIAAAGLWMTQAQWAQFSTQVDPEALWVLRVKPDWVGNMNYDERPTQGISSLHFLDHIRQFWDEQGQEPSMWSLLEPSAGLWKEQQRLFLVPDDWLERAQAKQWS